MADIAPRDVLSDIFSELSQENPDIVVLDADFHPASKLTAFRDRFPDRFIQIGIQEQNMMGVSAGLSTVGLIPFASTIAAFCSRRACDQVTTSIAIPHLNVKILGIYAGLFVGKNGASHQSLEDIAIMRAIAGMVVLQPVDAVETRAMIRFAAEYKGPVYIRIGRDPVPRYVPDGYIFRLGKSLQLREGTDMTFITYGDLLGETLEAALLLKKKGIEARVISMGSIKPIDEDAIIRAARETGIIVTVDNHSIYGGVGSAVTEVVCENYPVPVKRVGVKDVFGRSGTNEQMLKKFGLRAEDIAKAALEFLELRSKKSLK